MKTNSVKKKSLLFFSAMPTGCCIFVTSCNCILKLCIPSDLKQLKGSRKKIIIHEASPVAIAVASFRKKKSC